MFFSPSRAAVLSSILRDEYLTSAVRTNRFSERHFPANCISLRLSEVQMKFCERSLQALLSSARPSRLRCSLARSRETRFARKNRRACLQATLSLKSDQRQFSPNNIHT